MRKWIEGYGHRRLSRQPNESWLNSKYGNMDWREARQIYLPSIGVNVGVAWNWLKKLWKSYKIAGRTGEPRRDIAWKINRLQAGLDLERSEFPELEGMPLDDGETHPEWSAEDEQLRREEIEAERENDDWWISDY